jgi:hypothetical protein
MNIRKIFAGLGALVLSAGIAWSAGLFQTLPQQGGGSYCGSLAQNGACSATVPAGPTSQNGQESFPADTFGPGAAGSTSSGGGVPPQSVYFNGTQLSAGPMVDQTTVGTTQIIPNNTGYFFLDSAQGSAFTVTAPPNAIDGQILHIICETATVGTFTFVANTTVVTQVVKLPVAAACVAGVGYAWRYNLANLTWYRVY